MSSPTTQPTSKPRSGTIAYTEFLYVSLALILLIILICLIMCGLKRICHKKVGDLVPSELQPCVFIFLFEYSILSANRQHNRDSVSLTVLLYLGFCDIISVTLSAHNNAVFHWLIVEEICYVVLME